MSTGVEFHTGIPDTVDFACRLLRKACRRGATVLCLVPAPEIEGLDRLLWTSVERDFIAHVRLGQASEALVRRTPIWLAPAWPTQGAARDAVVNLGTEWPLQAAKELVARGTRVIELVGSTGEEVERGRGLWRQYKAAGLEIGHHPYRAADEG